MVLHQLAKKEPQKDSFRFLLHVYGSIETRPWPCRLQVVVLVSRIESPPRNKIASVLVKTSINITKIFHNTQKLWISFSFTKSHTRIFSILFRRDNQIISISLNVTLFNCWTSTALRMPDNLWVGTYNLLVLFWCFISKGISLFLRKQKSVGATWLDVNQLLHFWFTFLVLWPKLSRSNRTSKRLP